MLRRFSKFLDVLSEYLADRKGLIPLVGVLLVVVNLVLQFIPGAGVIADSDLLLHLGVITAVLGFMLAWAL